MFSFLSILLLWICGAHATTLVFVNNSREVAPKIHDYVVTFDTETQKITAYPTQIDSGDEVISGAIVCGTTYYGTWVDVPIATGLFAFDLSSGKLISYVTTENNYHVLQCTETEGTVLAVSNNFASPPVYELDQVTFGASNTISKKVIVEFPTGKNDVIPGFDTVFSFNPPQNELWISWTDKNEEGGSLEIYDTDTGKLKNTYSYPRGYDDPYFTIPSTRKGDVFKGAANDADKTEVYFYTLTISGKSLTASNKVTARYLWSGSQPQPICNGTGYSVQELEQNKVIVSYDIETGAQIDSFNMATITKNADVEVGDLACF